VTPKYSLAQLLVHIHIFRHVGNAGAEGPALLTRRRRHLPPSSKNICPRIVDWRQWPIQASEHVRRNLQPERNLPDDKANCAEEQNAQIESHSVHSVTRGINIDVEEQHADDVEAVDGRWDVVDLLVMSGKGRTSHHPSHVPDTKSKYGLDRS
jgi:hypothetical protein